MNNFVQVILIGNQAIGVITHLFCITYIQLHALSLKCKRVKGKRVR